MTQPDNTFSTTVYRKPTHTDQYLHWDSNHHITAKQSVFNTLAHRPKIVSSTKDSLDKELQHIKDALHACQFPKWALKTWHHRFIHNNTQNQGNSSNNNLTHTSNCTHMCISVLLRCTAILQVIHQVPFERQLSFFHFFLTFILVTCEIFFDRYCKF